MIEQVALSQLNVARYNPRSISNEELDKLAVGIEEFGFVQNVVANRQGSIVVAGHQRLKAAEKLKLKTVPVMWVDLSPSKEKALNLALNKISGEWDVDLLKQVLSEIGESDLLLSGFDNNEIEQFLAELESDELEPLCDEDEVPEIPKEPISKQGDVWFVGRHILTCGDSTIQTDIDKLLNGKRADMCFTDPPYLMDFTGAIGGDGEVNKHAKKHGKITNDKMSKEQGDDFLREIMQVLHTSVRGAFYVCFYRLGIDRIMNAMSDSNLKWRNLIIWHKGHLSLSNSDYKAMYEPIIYGWTDDYTPIVYGWADEHEWHSDKKQIDAWQDIEVPSFWQIPRTKKNTLHPTMKPVALCERAILNSSRAGQSVLDLFGGSGSTLIACEKSGRVCLMNEFEPKYVDVIIERWQNYTGLEATLNDKTFNQLKNG